MYKILLAGILFLFFLFPGCKEPVLKTTDLLPGEDNFNILFTDTITLETTFQREDSLRSDQLNKVTLGCMEEPVFGKTSASVFIQFLLPSDNISLGSGLQLDSLVLYLRYSGSYGDVTQPESYYVHRMQESIQVQDVYYSNKKIAVDANPIGQLVGHIPNLKDSVTIWGTKFPPVLRIRLDDALGQELLNQSEGANFANNTAFLEFFKGIQITTDTTNPGKGVLYLALNSIFSKLTLYYRNSTSDSLKLDFLISNQSATFNSFQHNYTGSLAGQALANTTGNDSLIFVQGLAGLKAKIKAPFISDFGRISVAKAELVLTALADPFQLDEDYPAPDRTMINRVDEAGSNTFVEDVFQGETYLGGRLEKITTPDGLELQQYRFNLAVYFQRAIDNPDTDNGLFMLSFPSNQTADRLILGGGNHPVYPAKLRFTYTKID